MLTPNKLYTLLINRYGRQGWWPLVFSETENAETRGIKKKAASAENDAAAIEEPYRKVTYHPGNYSYPHNKAQQFEIIAGSILAQNTSWKNAGQAVVNLHKEEILSPELILNTPIEKLAYNIKKSGYYNQKAKKLKIISEFLLDRGGEIKNAPKRKHVLSLWGIGPETADSILLYAYHVPVFVVDAYTKRIASRIGIINETDTYETVQRVFSEKLEKDYTIYNEAHALIVMHAKEHCRKKPVCTGCPLAGNCRFAFEEQLPQ